MQDAPLRVVTKEIEPFVFAGDELSGFSIDLWEAVARSIERDYEFVVVDAVSEQLEAVTQNRADAALAAISITQAREEIVDFSFSYFDAGLGILARQTSRAPLMAALRSGEFLWPLLRLFGVLVLVIVVAGHVVWLLERHRNDQF
ncbi:MAG: transporter substrate-binding domain-containing protein, partial [Caldilineaceae bacterium]|nr:transporter substrate-binding domain-containing protein [Caldilineaceae bacterium]